MENVWGYLRGNKLSSLVCNTYDTMRDASKEAWNFIANDAARITSIGTTDGVCIDFQGHWYNFFILSQEAPAI
ncbi:MULTISPECIES: hypothetical protein [Acidiphilium]|uniref:hypothetical protein n=1 Tax=Acidiphilium TaxID=522 RepID=UPI0011155B08|nr:MULTISPECIES: hypothetical protein [Acidiphilium]